MTPTQIGMIISTLALWLGYAIGSYRHRLPLEPYQKCKLCRNAHDKQLHDEYNAKFGEDV